MRDDADQLSCRINDENGWNASKLDGTTMVDDSTNDTEKPVRKFVASIPSNHSVVYVDKSVTERDLPELIVCYKKSTYQIVKDICVDEGVPSQDNFLSKTDAGVDQKPSCTFSSPENEMVEDKVDLDVPVSDALTLSVEKTVCDLNQCVLDDTEFSEVLGSQGGSSSDFDSRDLRPAGDEQLDKSRRMENAVLEKTPLELSVLMPDIDAEISCPKPSSGNTQNSKLSSSQMSTEDPKLPIVSSCDECGSKDKEVMLFSSKVVCATKASHHFSEKVNFTNLSLGSAAGKLDHVFQRTETMSPTVIPAAHESDNVHVEAYLMGTALASEGDAMDATHEEAKLDINAFILASDKFPGSAVNEITYPGKVEAGGITSELDSTAIADGKIAGPQNGLTEPVWDLQRNSLGETSFSATGPPSGLITYSGPIAYSGSVSVRSDSSATSTRSFTFPILQTEWINSPVKMAKADRKRFRKHRGWRHGLLCCKF